MNDIEKQKIIVRQSQLKLVNDYVTSCGICIPMKDMVAISEVMTDYVINGYSTKIGERLNKVDEFLTEKKNGKA